MKIKRFVIKSGWANNTNYLCSQNVRNDKFQEEYERIIAQHKDFIPLPLWCESFHDYPKSYGCDKLVIYGWYWRGEWADPTKEVVARFYRPKN